MTRPEFRESDQAGIKWILADVICDTAVILVGGIHERPQMWTHFVHLIWREPKDSKYSDCCLHTAFLLISTMQCKLP